MVRFLSIWLIILFVVGSSGLYMTEDVYAWYYALPLPALTLPGWVFPIVWNGLFILMALAVYRVGHKAGLVPFWCLLGVLALWSFLFFKIQMPMLALVDLVVALVLEFVCFMRFFKVSKISGGLFLPLILWSLFAFYLNMSIVLG